jgi:hypothetical protein
MELDRFLSRKEILIDDAGWGDLVLGVVIGALKLPERRYMERRISVSSFQPPNFENKQYLDDAVKIAEGRGLFCKFKNPTSITELIIQLLEDKGLKRNLEQRVYSYSREFTWPKVAQEYALLFRRLAKA